VGAVKGVTTEGEDVVNDEHASINVTEDLEPAGFAEALLGLTVGETREFTLAYPEDYQVEDLAGKQVNFTVTPTAVRQINCPLWTMNLPRRGGLRDAGRVAGKHRGGPQGTPDRRGQRA
jgi:FKBP-type peptidyl-prolyl cis-trans isomerase (trigger factor)